jgi:hypothetical protein
MLAVVVRCAAGAAAVTRPGTDFYLAGIGDPPPSCADQPVVAARVEALGAGKTVSRAAAADGLRDAAACVLATPAFRQAARRLARLIEPERGAANGASAVGNWLMSAASGR